jgi:tetratricopeptide (TPR) repeat protein
VQTKLNEIESQSKILLVLFRNLNQKKLAACLQRLEDSLQGFQVSNFHKHCISVNIVQLSRQINDTQFLQNLEKQLTDYLRSIRGDIYDIKIDMAYVKRHIGEALHASSSGPPPLPPRMDIFYGRETFVAELASSVTQDTSPRHAVVGLGGLGKTSVALAVLRHDSVISCFEDRRFWVPCAKATSVEELDKTLHACIVGGQDTKNPRGDVLSKLELLPSKLIILDNFETPWNIGSQNTVEEIIRSINGIPHTAMLMTMRGETPPCDFWNVHHLSDVDMDSACAIYNDLYHGKETQVGKDDDSDSVLPELFRTVGCLPLAITLMAKTAKKMRWSPARLLTEYNQAGTSLLGPTGKDSQHNMDLCVQMSFDRLTGRHEQSAVQLLTVLATLPDHSTFARDTPSFWVQGITDMAPAHELLLETSLAGRGEDLHYIHPVIRTYILHRPDLSRDTSNTLVDHACLFLKQHEAKPGDDVFKQYTATLRTEEQNLQAVLLSSTVAVTPTLIESMLILSRHQRATSPGLEVARQAMKLTDSVNGYEALYAEALHCYGLNLVGLDNYEEAHSHFSQARAVFESIPFPSRAFECLCDSIDALLMALPTGYKEITQDLMDEAEAGCKTLNDPVGIAQLEIITAKRHLGVGNRIEGLERIQNALTSGKFENQLLHLAQAHGLMAEFHFTLYQYQDGFSSGEVALQLHEKLGYREFDADAMLALGDACIDIQEYSKAKNLLTRALTRYIEVGNRTGTAQSWFGLGRIWLKTGQMDDAREAIQNSLTSWSSTPEGLGSFRQDGLRLCRFYIRRLDDPRAIPSKEEQEALENSWYSHILNDFEDEEDSSELETSES